MCQHCAEAASQNKQPHSVAADLAKHKADEKTLVIENSHSISIKPFSALEDVVVTGEKIMDILFPDNNLDSRDYEISIMASAAALATVPEELKLKAKTALLGLILIGYTADQLEEAKVMLKESFERAIFEKVKEANTAILKDFGLVPA